MSLKSTYRKLPSPVKNLLKKHRDQIFVAGMKVSVDLVRPFYKRVNNEIVQKQTEYYNSRAQKNQNSAYLRKRVQFLEKSIPTAKDLNSLREKYQLNPTNKSAKAYYDGAVKSAPQWFLVDLLLEIRYVVNDEEWFLSRITYRTFKLGRHEESLNWNAQLEKLANGNVEIYSIWDMFRKYRSQLILENSEEANPTQPISLEAKLTEARQTHDTILEQSPYPITIYVGIGYYFQRVGLFEESNKYYLDNLQQMSQMQSITQNSSQINASIALTNYSIALNHIRLFNFRNALPFFEQAIKLAKEIDIDNLQLEVKIDSLDYWVYCYAYALERAGQINEAIKAYEESVDLNGHDQNDSVVRYRFFRIGKLYYSQEKHKKAYELLRMSLSEQMRNVDSVKIVAGRFEIMNANQALLEAEISKDLDIKKYVIAAKAFESENNFQKAAYSLLQTKEFIDTARININDFQKTAYTRKVTRYAEFCRTLPIKDNVILYETNLGEQIGCNPLAICKKLLTDTRFKDFTHIWSITKGDIIPEHLQDIPNVKFVIRESYGYIRFLASAKYLINNSTFGYYFTRRDEQQYLNTWHGTPLKYMGKRIKGEVLSYGNVARNFLQATCLALPNEHTANVLLNDYEVKNFTTAQVSIVGSPRLDKVINSSANSSTINSSANSSAINSDAINTDDSKLANLKEYLGIEEEKKIVLYAPTWRGTIYSKSSSSDFIEETLKTLANIPNTVVIYSGHYYNNFKLNNSKYSNNVIFKPNSLDSTELFPIVDVLVSDYSSIFIDFMCTKKPVILFQPDYEEYNEARGLYLSSEDLIDDVIYDYQALSQTLETRINELNINLANSPNSPAEIILSEKYSHAFDMFVSHEDGHATERTIENFFFSAKNGVFKTPETTPEIVAPEKDSSKKITPKKTRIVFYSSMMTNGITTSILNLLNSLSQKPYVDKFDITLLVGRNITANNEDRLAGLDKVPNNVSVLPTISPLLFTPEERYVEKQVNDTFSDLAGDLTGDLTGELDSTRNSILQNAYRRQWRTFLGDASNTIDAYINFDGYSNYWSALFAFVPNQIRNIIFLHNDLIAENIRRFPNLKFIFSLYKYYSAIASVSSELTDLHRQELIKPYGLSFEQFKTVHNTFNYTEVEKLSNEPLPPQISDFVDRFDKVLVTIGRLSVEKNQTELIEAFARLKSDDKTDDTADDKNSASRNYGLIIVGSGVLKGQLEQRVRELGIEDSVLFTGQTDNPHNIVKACDLFVFPSLHEGFPMVILEAMQVHTPIIALPLPYVKEAVKFMELNVATGFASSDIYDAITEFFGRTDSSQPPNAFDAQKFQNLALTEFFDAIKKESGKQDLQ